MTAMPTAEEAARRVGDHLDMELRLRGVNVSAFARAIGVSQPTARRWTKGEAMPEHENVEAIQQFLGLRAGTIYRWAGYIDDSGLVDPEALHPRVRESIRALLALERGGDDRSSTDQSIP